jgi:RNA polymerase sigma factor (sigma-70 family)
VKPEEKVDLIEDWHGRWHGVLLRVLTERITNYADVQDLAQEVYLRLLRFDKLDLVRNPRTYLYRVAVNVAEEWRLKARQAKPHTDVELIEQVAGDDSERSLKELQTSEVVRKALSELPLTCRTVLVLHCKDDMTYEQIAVHMGISRRMVKRHVANGYATLRESLASLRKGVNQNGD